MNDSYDVIVVGARCAGAATARLLAAAGLDVLLVDRTRLPADTVSTHALMLGGVIQLRRWGLLDLPCGFERYFTSGERTPCRLSCESTKRYSASSARSYARFPVHARRIYEVVRRDSR